MRILDQLGRLEVADQGPTKLVQGAMQPRPALGPAEIPGMMEVELVQTAQATMSQAAPSTGSQGTAGRKLSSDQKTQGGRNYHSPKTNTTRKQWEAKGCHLLLEKGRMLLYKHKPLPVLRE